VTGGGQINLTPSGVASYGFNAKPDKKNPGPCTDPCGVAASGHFNYVNHVTGLHVNGPVDHIIVTATNGDGSPKTVQFCGVCGPATKPDNCAFTVTVEDHGEPGTADQFGVVVTGDLTQNVSKRVVARGNIQFHPTH
jgi:hypothetical protein